MGCIFQPVYRCVIFWISSGCCALHSLVEIFFCHFSEANLLDRIKMTKNSLEYDQQIFTTTNLIFWIWPKFATPTNINFTPKKYAGAVSLESPPALASILVVYWSAHMLHPSFGNKPKLCTFLLFYHQNLAKNRWKVWKHGKSRFRPAFEVFST